MSITDFQSQVTDHNVHVPSDPPQNVSIHEMKHQFDLPEESMTPSLPLRRSHTSTPYAYRPRRSSRKRFYWLYNAQQKFQHIMENLVPIYFTPPRTLNFQMHEDILNRLGLWDFVNLKFDVPTRHDLLVELITTYNHSKRCSFINGKRVDITRAKLASALKLPVKKGRRLIYETGSAEGNGTSLFADSVAFLDEFFCNWILLHDDIWIMPPEVVEATMLIEQGQPWMVDWAGLLWLMVKNEIMQGKNIVRCHYASHLMCLLKSQVESLFPDVSVCDGGGDAEVDHKDEEIIEEMGAIQAGENEEEDGCEEEDDKISADEEGDVQMEEQGEGDHTVVDDTEKQEHDGREREDTVEEDENDHEATKSHGMEVQCMELSLRRIENKDCSDEISADFENDMVRNNVLVPCPAVRDILGPEGHHLRRCITAEEGDVYETKEIEIGESKPSENYPTRGFGACITPTDGFSPSPSMFAGHISSGAALEQDKYESKLMFGAQLSSNKDMSIRLAEVRHKRLRMDDDVENTFVCGDYDTYFEHIQLLLRRWKSASESKQREFEEARMGRECLLKELQHRDALIDKLYRDMGEELQKKQAEVHRLERELLLMEDLLTGYKDALCRCRGAFDEYILQHPRPVEPLYRDVDGGDGLVLKAVEVGRMEAEKAEKAEKEKLMISVEKMVMEVEEEWSGKMDGYLQQVDLLNKRLEEKVIDVSDIKQHFASRKALKQHACSSQV